MTFFNWNLVSPNLPTFFTYIIQPSLSQVTTGINPELLSTIQFKDSVKLPLETVSHNTNNITCIKEEHPNGETVDDDIKEEPDLNQDRNWFFDGTSKDWLEAPIKEEKLEIDEKDKPQLEEDQEEEDQTVTIVKEDIKEESRDECNIKKSVKKSSKISAYSCDHCSYTTNWKGNLTKHIVSRHTALEEINWLECDHCSYKGKTRDYLKCHLLHVHNISVKWFHCPHCSFKAKLKGYLDRHIIVNHTNSSEIKWFVCDHCSYKAKFKSNLKEHILSKHTESSKIQWFHCEFCSFKAKRKRNLKFHHLNKHTESEKIHWFHCESCPVKCKRKSAMNLHVATVHGHEEKSKKSKVKTKEIPVFIENKLCWKRVVVDAGEEDHPFYCTQCNFSSNDKVIFKKHVLKEHVVTEFKQENDQIVTTSYKTKDVIVIVNDVPCVKKIVEHPLLQNRDLDAHI